MKATTRILFLGLVTLISLISSAWAQDDWMRVSSNDGQFSIEVPAKHTFFGDPNGFVVGDNGRDYSLKNMYMLSAYVDDTLVSFEAYDGPKGAFQPLYDVDALGRDGRSESEKKIGKAKVKEIVNKTDKYYSVRQFINTKDHIYVITAASRKGETPALKRFLDSLSISDEAGAVTGGATTFAQLAPTSIKVIYADKTASSAAGPAMPPSKPDPVDPTVQPVIVLRSIRGSYVPGARARRVSGTVRLRLKLAADGSIPEVTVVETLPEGLERQSIFAGLRTKFLPREKDGVAVSAVKTLEFGYHVY